MSIPMRVLLFATAIVLMYFDGQCSRAPGVLFGLALSLIALATVWPAKEEEDDQAT